MHINYIKKYLSNDDLNDIRDFIAEIEKSTSGEIRVCFHQKKAWIDRKKTSRELALKEFFKLGMDKTELKTGVLLLIMFSERIFEIIADEGINSKIDSARWKKITEFLTSEFRIGNYKTGILKGLEEIKNVLVKDFPRTDDDKNELPDEIVIE
jgi:uncharacterized membrane protein